MLTETDYSGLVGEFQGETYLKTKALINASLGGVVFIRNADELMRPRLMGGTFGTEAINSILEMMANYENQFILFLSGHSGSMLRLLDSSGIRNRFQKIISFSDYTPQEMYIRFEDLCDSRDINISMQAKPSIIRIFESEYSRRNSNSGNFHFVNKLFEAVLTAQTARIGLGITDQAETDILPADVYAKL